MVKKTNLVSSVTGSEIQSAEARAKTNRILVLNKFLLIFVIKIQFIHFIYLFVSQWKNSLNFNIRKQFNFLLCLNTNY